MSAISYTEVYQEALLNRDDKAFMRWCASRNLIEQLDQLRNVIVDAK